VGLGRWGGMATAGLMAPGQYKAAHASSRMQRLPESASQLSWRRVAWHQVTSGALSKPNRRAFHAAPEKAA
jgi:hypothetical protein